MEKLFEYSKRLISDVDTTFVRYLYGQINWENKLLGIVGPRGVGKTTLVLQYIKNNLDIRHTLYVSAEDFYFSKHRLSDVASDFVKWGGKYLFIDEIHKYPDWSNELKLIYDYHNQLKAKNKAFYCSLKELALFTSAKHLYNKTNPTPIDVIRYNLGWIAMR